MAIMGYGSAAPRIGKTTGIIRSAMPAKPVMKPAKTPQPKGTPRAKNYR